MSSGRSVAVALSGTGARGAYEIGALSIILPEVERRDGEVTLLCGTSAGAINVALLGSLAHLPARSQVALAIERWQTLARADAVGSFRSPSAPLKLARMAGDALGVPGVRADGLFDPGPLRSFLDRQLDWSALHRNVDAGILDAVCVVATQLATGRPLAFVETSAPHALPDSTTMPYVPARLTGDHVQAAAAVPVILPAVHVDEPAEARGWYLDGAARLTKPLAPALELGAERLVAVGFDAPNVHRPARDRPSPRLVDVVANVLDGLLVDHVTTDVQRLAAMNDLLGERDDARSGRPVPFAFVAPRDGQTLGPLARTAFSHRYSGLRAVARPEVALLGRLLQGRTDAGGDLLSILALTPEHIDALIAAGKRDAARWMRSNPDVWSEELAPAPLLPAARRRVLHAVANPDR